MSIVRESRNNSTRQVREGLIRALAPAHLRASEKGDGELILSGLWAVFNRWTQINDWIEGTFLERIQHGAFEKTLGEQTPKLLFQHGRSPQLGMAPLGTVLEAKEEARGAFGKAKLFGGLPEYLIDGLRAGEYGASFRFRIIRESVNRQPGKSAHNPDGLPERTIVEAAVDEFSVVTWGAYPDAQLTLRAMTAELGDPRDRPNPSKARRDPAGLSPDARRTVLAGAATSSGRGKDWLGDVTARDHGFLP